MRRKTMTFMFVAITAGILAGAASAGIIGGTSITAMASSFTAGSGPEKTIDGSGLNALDQHSTATTDMWLSSAPSPQWILYEFDAVYTLSEMRVWNFNAIFEPNVGFGAENVTIEYSSNGFIWTSLGILVSAQAPAEATYVYNTVVDFGGAEAKYVRIEIHSTWGGSVAERCGLSEVQFRTYDADWELNLGVSGEGSLNPATGTHTYPDGTPVTVTATPNDGWGFFQWTGTAVDAGVVTAPYNPTVTIIMDDDYTLQAEFVHVLRVDHEAPETPHDGSSWGKAYLTLYEALAQAKPADHIWVAEGDYYPNQPLGFVLKEGVSVYGGFQGVTPAPSGLLQGETCLNQRDWAAHPTTLNGAGCFHVVYQSVLGSGSNPAVLDGFTVTGGNASHGTKPADWRDNCGGGICLFGNANAILANLIICGNNAWGGGGIACLHSADPQLFNVLIHTNTAMLGAGAYCYNVSRARFVNVTFADNAAMTGGGAICSRRNSTPDLVNCILWSNTPDQVYFPPAGAYSSKTSIVVSDSAIEGSVAAFVLSNNGTAIAAAILAPGTSPIGSTYHLNNGPCVDTGNTAAAQGPFDLGHGPRVNGSDVDMGAYEF